MGGVYNFHGTMHKLCINGGSTRLKQSWPRLDHSNLDLKRSYIKKKLAHCSNEIIIYVSRCSWDRCITPNDAQSNEPGQFYIISLYFIQSMNYIISSPFRTDAHASHYTMPKATNQGNFIVQLDEYVRDNHI
jgi:hypothetical protein